MTSTCEFCRKEFQQRRPRAPTRFCSCSCSSRARDKSTFRGTFPKGHDTWNKGLKAWRKGYRHSEETRRRIAASITGQNAPNWKGGISPENERQRKTAAYKAWRKAVFERDDYRCLACGDRARAGHRVTLHADHIKPFAFHPELRLDVANGRTLCAPCHRQTPTFGASRDAFTGQEARLESPSEQGA